MARTSRSKKAVCPSCGHTCKNNQELVLHMQNGTNDCAANLVRCSGCYKPFANTIHLERHQLHKPTNDFCKPASKRMDNITILDPTNFDSTSKRTQNQTEEILLETDYHDKDESHPDSELRSSSASLYEPIGNKFPTINSTFHFNKRRKISVMYKKNSYREKSNEDNKFVFSSHGFSQVVKYPHLQEDEEFGSDVPDDQFYFADEDNDDSSIDRDEKSNNNDSRNRSLNLEINDEVPTNSNHLIDDDDCDSNFSTDHSQDIDNSDVVGDVDSDDDSDCVVEGLLDVDPISKYTSTNPLKSICYQFEDYKRLLSVDYIVERCKFNKERRENELLFVKSDLYLLKLLDCHRRSRIPNSQFDRTIEWINFVNEMEDFSMLRETSFGCNIPKRKTYIRQLYTKLYGKQFVNAVIPKITKIPVTIETSARIANFQMMIEVTKFDWKEVLVDLLSNDDIMSLKNLQFYDKNDLTKIHPENTEISSVINSQVFRMAHKRLCTKPDDVLWPLVLYNDEITFDQIGKLKLDPISVSFLRLTTKMRNQALSWRIFGFIHSTDKTVTKYRLNSKHKIKIYHHVLNELLSGLVAIQKEEKGIPWTFTLDNGEKKTYNLKLYVQFIIGDTKGHDHLCGRMGSHTRGMKQVVRDCDCPYILASDVDRKCNFRRMNNVKQLFPDGMKEISFHAIENAFWNVDMGDQIHGIYGATPAEPLHVFGLGLCDYITKGFLHSLSTVAINKIESTIVDIVSLAESQSIKSEFLSMNAFRHGSFKVKLLTGEDWVARLLVIYLSLMDGHTCGFIASCTGKKDSGISIYGLKRLKKWFYLFEETLLIIQWMKLKSHTLSSILNKKWYQYKRNLQNKSDNNIDNDVIIKEESSESSKVSVSSEESNTDSNVENDSENNTDDDDEVEQLDSDGDSHDSFDNNNSDQQENEEGADEDEEELDSDRNSNDSFDSNNNSDQDDNEGDKEDEGDIKFGDSFLHYDDLGVDSIMERKIRSFAKRLKRRLKNKAGNEMNFPKFHFLFHIIHSIIRHGPVENYDGSRPESNAREIVKSPALRTQKSHRSLSIQTASRYHEFITIVEALRLANKQFGRKDSTFHEAMMTTKVGNEINTCKDSLTHLLCGSKFIMFPFIRPGLNQNTHTFQIKWLSSSTTSSTSHLHGMDPKMLMLVYKMMWLDPLGGKLSKDSTIIFHTEMQMENVLYRCHPSFRNLDVPKIDWVYIKWDGISDHIPARLMFILDISKCHVYSEQEIKEDMNLPLSDNSRKNSDENNSLHGDTIGVDYFVHNRYLAIVHSAVDKKISKEEEDRINNNKKLYAPYFLHSNIASRVKMEKHYRVVALNTIRGKCFAFASEECNDLQEDQYAYVLHGMKKWGELYVNHKY